MNQATITHPSGLSDAILAMSMEDVVKVIGEYDFTVLVDASTSMGEEDCPGGASRWNYMQETLVGACRELTKIDSDGIDLVTFQGAKVQSFTGITYDNVKQTLAGIRPSGSTPLHEALKAGFACADKNNKKDMLIVFTDGVPDDRAAAAKLISDRSNAQTADDELTILFVQIGHDSSARAYLTKLDDDLSCKFDIVDVKSQAQLEAAPSLLHLVVGAIND